MNQKWKVRVSKSLDRGSRAYMEDFVLNHFERAESDVIYGVFGVMDGHGGAEAAEFVTGRLTEELRKSRLFWSENDDDVLESIKEVYARLQSLMWIEREKWQETINGYKSTAGTTATILIIRNNTLYVGHVGDSAMVLAHIDVDGQLKSEQITQDHKPEDINEKKRIETCGGSVRKKCGIARVVWNRKRLAALHEVENIPFLAVARSLGDLWSYDINSNTYHVSPCPDVIAIKLDPLKHRAIILASDGVWNVVDDKTSVNIVASCYKEDKLRPWNPAELLVNYSLYQWKKRKMRSDNVSAIVLTLAPDDQEYEMWDLKDDEKVDLVYSEILKNEIQSKPFSDLIEIISNSNIIPPSFKLNSSLSDAELLQKFILSSETFSQHCIPWREDLNYWRKLWNSFENLGITRFPNFVFYFEHSRIHLEDLIMSFPWSIICQQCIEERKDFRMLYEWPLLDELWILFYQKIIKPNLCFIADQLTQPSIHLAVMEYILTLREVEIKDFISTKGGLLPVYTLRKTQSCNTEKLLYNLGRLCDDNNKQNICTTRVLLKRSRTQTITKQSTESLSEVTSFNSGSDTPPMSPVINCDYSTKTSFCNSAVNKRLRKYSLTKKCYIKTRKRHNSKTFLRAVNITEKKFMRFVLREKSRTA